MRRVSVIFDSKIMETMAPKGGVFLTKQIA